MGTQHEVAANFLGGIGCARELLPAARELKGKAGGAEQLPPRFGELKGKAGQVRLPIRFVERKGGVPEAISARYLRATLRVLDPGQWPENPKAQKFCADRFRELQHEAAKIAAEHAQGLTAEAISARYLTATRRVLDPARWPANQTVQKFCADRFRELQEEAAKDAEDRDAA